MLQWLKSLFSPPKPAGPPVLIKRFESSEATISQELSADAEQGWSIDSGESQTLKLFEVEISEIDNCLLTYRAELKSEDVKDKCYLEMWCRFPGRGEFFSKGFHNALKGSNNWSSCEIPFFLKRGQQPDLVKLNLTLEGGGKVWIRNVELSYTPFE